MTAIQNKEQLKKVELKRIDLSELPKSLPDFKNAAFSKDILIENWLAAWIKSSLESGKIKENQLIPKKTELAFHLSVSVGTIQNAIRYLEDKGIVASKQRIGTVVAGPDSSKDQFRKLKSKREKIITEIKKYIINNNYKPGQSLPSSRQFAAILASSNNTTRLALEFLYSQGYLKSKPVKGNETYWVVEKIPALEPTEKNEMNEIKSDTLVEQIEQELKTYISKNYKVGDKLCAHSELSTIFNVSIKTIHDALKRLIEQEILLSRRGRYGTTVIKLPFTSSFEPKPESSIFASAKDAAFYSYQKIENSIKSMIKENYDIAEKLPPMETLAEKFDVSTNTIRKALQNLEQQGIITFSRGRYGGTFITNIPETESHQAFKWLAVNPHYSKVYQN